MTSDSPTPSMELLCGQFCSISDNEENSYCLSKLLVGESTDVISVIPLLNPIINAITVGYAFGKQRHCWLYTEMLI